MKLKKSYLIAGIAILLILCGAQAVLGFNPDDEKTFLATKKCPNCDLSNALFSGAQLSRATWVDGTICNTNSVGVCNK